MLTVVIAVAAALAAGAAAATSTLAARRPAQLIPVRVRRTRRVVRR